MHQFQPFAPQQMPTVAEYAFPSVLQFLQSEWRRFERDRNEWDIEKAEMKARIAFLEGEKRGVDNAKMDLMKRVKMLEYALRQERGKYLESKEGSAVNAQVSLAQAAPGVTPTEGASGASGAVNIKTQNRMSTYSNPGQSMSQVSPTSTNPGLDPLGRAKSREFLRICLQEISYLTASVPQSIAMAAPPAPTRLARNESDRRSAALSARNRKSDFYPDNVQTAAPPPLARASSVPVSTLQSLKGIKPAANSPPLDDPSLVGIAGPPVEDKAEDATLRQFGAAPSQHPRLSVSHQSRPTRDELLSEKVAQVPTPSPVQDSVKATVIGSKLQKEIVISDEGEAVSDKDEDPVTVVHSPMSGEHWHAQLQRAGRELERPEGKRGDARAEDEAQLSKDVQDKFNISPERLNKMVKEWDKSKQEGFPGQKSMRKKKSKDSDELASLSVDEAEDTEIGSKEGEAGIDEPARWRPKVTLKRHLDTVRSIVFHPDHKSILSGSEDGTMKYWNLESALKESKRPQVCEIDPIHTYRGHTKTITSVAISAELNKCFSASADSTIRSYKLVPMNKETYSRLDPTLPQTTFVGHTDAVWDIRLFPISISSSQLLGSISADGTLKIWDTETKGSPLRSSWGYHGQQSPPIVATSRAMPVPTGLDFCPTDLKKVIVSYSNSVMKLFDIETGKDILTFKSDETYDGTPATQINKVVCHPTLPLVVSGHEDRYIRFFDLNNGSCSYSMLSHLDAVSSLDIDPAGLVLCSGGHDSSVRLWDIASSTRACLQEFTGHRRKGDEGVCTVHYHPTMHGLMATGGADSIVKVYGRN
ncbi:hypothetical protein BGZ67_008105 [Mortierella alpina]|nr:hypothetical protein BGZ67_008105 [Mortierella alpina]